MTAAATPTARARTIRLPLAFALIFLGLVVGIGLLWYGLSPSSPPLNPATQAGLVYSRDAMEWYSGPQVRSAQVLPLRLLPRALVASVSARVRHDVNEPYLNLLRRYGPNRQVALVILYGVYNSLPPDEGVEIRGDAITLVDPKTNRILLLMD